MSYEKVSMPQKREALITFVDDIMTNDFGEDFVIYDTPKEMFLNMGSRMDRREVQENSNGDIRHIDIFFDSPVSPGTFPEVDISGIFRQGNVKKGSVDAFRLMMHYGVEYDNNGEINNRKTFENLFVGSEPDGIIRQIDSTNHVKKNVGGTDRTVLLSQVTNPTMPPQPRNLGSGGSESEYAHYAEFQVMLTDM